MLFINLKTARNFSGIPWVETICHNRINLPESFMETGFITFALTITNLSYWLIMARHLIRLAGFLAFIAHSFLTNHPSRRCTFQKLNILSPFDCCSRPLWFILVATWATRSTIRLIACIVNQHIPQNRFNVIICASCHYRNFPSLPDVINQRYGHVSEFYNWKFLRRRHEIDQVVRTLQKFFSANFVC